MPVPNTTPGHKTGPIALETEESSTRTRSRCSRSKKALGLLVLGACFVGVKHGLGGHHGLKRMFSGEFKEGWEMVRGGGGREHGHGFQFEGEDEEDVS